MSILIATHGSIIMISTRIRLIKKKLSFSRFFPTSHTRLLSDMKYRLSRFLKHFYILKKHSVVPLSRWNWWLHFKAPISIFLLIAVLFTGGCSSYTQDHYQPYYVVESYLVAGRDL